MKILVIDDDNSLNSGICTCLNSNQFDTVSAFNGNEGLERIQTDSFDLVISDIQMPGLNGIELLKRVRKRNTELPFIIMTAFASVENAVEAMKMGADDYLTKPINLKELIIKINKIQKSQKIIEENNYLKNKIAEYEIPEIIGTSETVEHLREMIRRVSAKSNIPVTIYGKSGTGKELVARNIHFRSDRKNNPFVPINCAMLSDDLLESELFGYVKGAFTGAQSDKIGLLESGNGGTIFLDEISEMSPRVQAKLLRVLQDGNIQPVGSNQFKNVNIRFISASNRELSELVNENKFRDDLYYRLNVIEINVPSLMARKSDIPLLIRHFLKKYENADKYFSEESIKILQNYTWPGNIRELENLIRQLLVTTDKKMIEKDYLPTRIINSEPKDEISHPDFELEYKIAFSNTISSFDKSYLTYHLRKNDFNISKTAENINLSRVSLHKKINEYEISLPIRP